MLLLSSLAIASDGTMERIGLCVVIAVVIVIATLLSRRRRHLKNASGDYAPHTIITVNNGLCVDQKDGNPGIPFLLTLEHKQIVRIKECKSFEENRI
jgi:hypothetical protein